METKNNANINAKAPEWYTIEEVTDAIKRQVFFHHGMTLEVSIALDLQNAFEKGFEMGRGVDPASENSRLREALKARVMVWNDSSDRNYRVCDLCGSAEGVRHEASCVLA